MKRLMIALLMAAVSGLAQASGLTYAVDSLQKAQAQAKPHVLIFYTSPA